MPENLSTQLIDEANSHAIDLMRVGAGMRNDILVLLRALEDDIAGKVESATAKSGLNYARLVSLLRQTRATIATAYEGMASTNEDDLTVVARATVTHFTESLNGIIEVQLASTAFTKESLLNLVRQTYINGAVSEDWWKRQGEQLAHRFALQMRIGMLQGESVGDLVRRVRGTRASSYSDGLMTIPTYQAEALVRTSVIAVGNTARLQSVIANKDLMTGIQWVATLDNRTTVICLGLDGLTWSLPESGDVNDYGSYKPQGHRKQFPGATAHWNCRSTQIAVLKSFDKLKGPKAWKRSGGSGEPIADTFKQRLIDKGFSAEEADAIKKRTRASMDGQAGIDQGFKGWLNSKSNAFQDDLLGETAAKLWRKGSLSLQDLTTQNNRPLSAEELLAKVGKRGAIARKPLPGK